MDLTVVAIDHPAADLFTRYTLGDHFLVSFSYIVIFDPFHQGYEIVLSVSVIHLPGVIWVVPLPQRVPNRGVFLSKTFTGGFIDIHGKHLIGVTEFFV